MKDIISLVIEVVKEVGEDQENEVLINAVEDTRLFGENLDSLGIVFLLTDLEAKISDEVGVDLALADERAMSQKTSPFRSVRTLAKYVQGLLDDQKRV